MLTPQFVALFGHSFSRGHCDVVMDRAHIDSGEGSTPRMMMRPCGMERLLHSKMEQSAVVFPC